MNRNQKNKQRIIRIKGINEKKKPTFPVITYFEKQIIFIMDYRRVLLTNQNWISL
jgi:hypothetical protein